MHFSANKWHTRSMCFLCTAIFSISLSGPLCVLTESIKKSSAHTHSVEKKRNNSKCSGIQSACVILYEWKRLISYLQYRIQDSRFISLAVDFVLCAASVVYSTVCTHRHVYRYIQTYVLWFCENENTKMFDFIAFIKSQQSQKQSTNVSYWTCLWRYFPLRLRRRQWQQQINGKRLSICITTAHIKFHLMTVFVFRHSHFSYSQNTPQRER